MGKIINAKAAPYPKSNIPETKAISTFNNIVDENVKTDIKNMDKVPNYDGLLEIVDIDQTPIGHFFVQIKKLPDKNSKHPKYQSKIAFLAFCESTILPILHIVVDIKNEVAYWRLIDTNFLKTLKIKENAKSVNVDFPKENIIKKGNSDYLEEWKEIIREYQRKIYGYDSLEKDHENLKKSYALLSSKSNPLLGLEKPEFENLHKFLDKLNMQLDIDFFIIKKIFYNSCWKLGIAYNNYTKNEMTYMLYPINFNKNELQIKEISNKLKDELSKVGLSLNSHYRENPFYNRPEDYANEFIKIKIEKIFEKKLLPINHISLFREIMFSFIDKFHDCLGLQIKNYYTIEEMRFSFNIYLPIWIDEVLSNKKISLGKQGFIDPNLILVQLNQKELNKFDIKVKERIQENQLNNTNLIISNETYPLKLIVYLLNSSNFNNITGINRLYLPPNYERLKISDNNFIWSVYSSEDIKENITRFYNEIQVIYDYAIDAFFPSLKKHLEFFSRFDKIIIVLNVKDEYKSHDDIPSMELYYLKNIDIAENKIEIYIKNKEAIPIDIDVEMDFGSEIMIDDQKYIFQGMSSSVLISNFGDLPMYNYLYELLNDSFKDFFGN